jgi:hypothetical protein
MEEVIPGPGVLRQRHGNQFNGREHQQEGANGFSRAGRPCGCIAAGSIYVGSMIQKLPTFFVDTTPWEAPWNDGWRCESHSACPTNGCAACLEAHSLSAKRASLASPSAPRC